MPDFNPHYVAVVFCAKCQSNRVDVARWRDAETAVFRCSSCGHEGEVSGFTIGRAMRAPVGPALVEAVQDMTLPELAEMARQREAVGVGTSC